MSSGAKFNWFGDIAKDKLRDVVAEFLWLAGQDAITQSVNDVPLDTGTLRRSGVVTVGELPSPEEIYQQAQSGKGNKDSSATAGRPSGGGIRPKVYASYNTPYAIKLHESPHWLPRSWKYTKSGKKVAKPAVGTWKWLSKALLKVQKRAGTYAARARRKVGV